jgi:hypothetical protein
MWLHVFVVSRAVQLLRGRRTPDRLCTAAIDLDLEFEAKAENARLTPKLCKAGGKGTRETVVRPNHAVVYRVQGDFG